MSRPSARPIGAARLRAMIADGGEVALLDVREEGRFAQGHLLFAVPLPLSRLELRILDVVPRRGVPVVLSAGAEDGGLIARAAERLSAFGYSDLSCLDGGVEAWKAAGFEVFSGVNVPSKAFGEFIEAACATPHIPAAELKKLIDAGADMVVLDSRPMAEYQVMNIPGAVNVPGAELVYRIHDIAPSADTMIVVNCAGRTRSIIGAQSLINAGVANRVVALENGTMGWHLAGFDLERDMDRAPPAVSADGMERARAAASRIAARSRVRTLDHATLHAWRRDDGRSLFLLDVRTPEEYAAGHLAGALPAPGGQLVQATDRYVGVRGARLVLIDGDGVRAKMTASWLIQMGWNDVSVLEDALAAGPLVEGEHRAHVPGLEGLACETVTPEELAALVDANEAAVVDLADSRSYRLGHIPGAWFAVRPRLPGNLGALPETPLVVLTSPDGVCARLAAPEAAAQGRAVKVLDGGTRAWRAAGLEIEDGLTHAADATDDVWYRPYDLDGGTEGAMRQYLDWEVDLVGQIRRDGTARFRAFA